MYAKVQKQRRFEKLKLSPREDLPSRSLLVVDRSILSREQIYPPNPNGDLV